MNRNCNSADGIASGAMKPLREMRNFFFGIGLIFIAATATAPRIRMPTATRNVPW
jgi:hypothetical protein